MSEEKRALLMQGNEACALGALDAGLEFYAGYPITPATEIAEILSGELPKRKGAFIQIEDELGCMGAVIGASLAGKKSMTATSGPGFTLIQENLGLAAMAEVPCVVISVQRTGPSTGIATLTGHGDMMMGRWGTHGDHPIICLAPSTVEECYNLTIEAFNLSERFRNPVIVFTDAVLGHIRERVILPNKKDMKLYKRVGPSVPPEEFQPYKPLKNGVPEMGTLGDEYRYYISGTYRDENGKTIGTNTSDASRVLRRIYNKVEEHKGEIDRIETFLMDDAEIAVVCYGITARAGKQAVIEARKEGIKAGLVRLISIWPFPEKLLVEAVEGCKCILAPEMNLGQMVLEVERSVKGKMPVYFKGVVGGRLIMPQEITAWIREVNNK